MQSTSPVSSQIYDLHKFGVLQHSEVVRPRDTADCPFQRLIQYCADTPCNAALQPVNDYLPPQLLNIVNQTRKRRPASVCMTKTADGLVFTVAAQNSVHRIIGGLFGPALYEKDCQTPLQLFSIADRPGAGEHVAQHEMFHLKMHNDNCELHEISRNSITQHILNQIMAVRPTVCGDDARKVFESDNVGTLSTRLLVGPQVHDLKCAFLKMVSKAAQSGESVYNKTIRLKPELGSMLMLKYALGDIQCDRCKDGIIAFRMRKETQKRTFVFMLNTDDFHEGTPCPDKEQSMAQLFKMDYKPDGNRIVVVDHPEQIEDEEHAVCLAWTVQQNANSLEKAFRAHMLAHHGCHLFPLYCHIQHEQQQKQRTPASARGCYDEGDSDEEDGVGSAERAMALLGGFGG